MLEPKTSDSPTSASSSRLGGSGIALIVGGLAIFLVMLYYMEIKSPILLGLATAIMLWPLKERRAVRAIMLATGFLLLMWFLSQLGQVLLPFILAYVLAYLFNPVVDALKEKLSTPRWVSSLIVTLVIVGTVAMFFIMLVPSLVGEMANMAQKIPMEINNLKAWVENSGFVETLVSNGVIESKTDFITSLTDMGNQAAGLGTGLSSVGGTILASLNSLVGMLAMMGIIPILLFYTLKDYPDINDKLVALFPTFGGQRDYLSKAGDVVGEYLRGQLTISAIAAVLVSIALTLLGVPFGLLIGILTGVLNLIPSFGIFITYAIGILIALVFSPPEAVLLNTLYVAGVLAGESFLESTVLTPNIMGEKLGLHPVLILLALFIFGYFMNLVGLLIAVPATALLVAAYQAAQDDITLELSAYTTTPTVQWSARKQPGGGASANPYAAQTPPSPIPPLSRSQQPAQQRFNEPPRNPPTQLPPNYPKPPSGSSPK